MPLHLLGKKSWNVYNAANIERVRRDEAIVQAQKEEAQRQSREQESRRRTAILRGETQPEQVAKVSADADSEGRPRAPQERRKRKRRGEDDTDFEMRMANERGNQIAAARQSDRDRRPLEAGNSPPIVDESGHINLFGHGAAAPNDEPSPTYNKKDKDPWYSVRPEVQAMSVGAQDVRRAAREARRVALGDPLLAMRSAAAQVREFAKVRKAAIAERDRGLIDRPLKRDGRNARGRHEGFQRGSRSQSHEFVDFDYTDARISSRESDRRWDYLSDRSSRRQGKEDGLSCDTAGQTNRDVGDGNADRHSEREKCVSENEWRGQRDRERRKV